MKIERFETEFGNRPGYRLLNEKEKTVTAATLSFLHYCSRHQGPFDLGLEILVEEYRRNENPPAVLEAA